MVRDRPTYRSLLTKFVRRLHHLDDGGEEIGVDDHGTGVISPDVLERLLQQGVVVDGNLVEIFEAPGARLVARRVGAREEEQVWRRASQRRDPGHDDGPRPLLDYYL
jgi:hypothetical protein